MHLHHLQEVLTLYFAKDAKIIKITIIQIIILIINCYRLTDCILSFNNDHVKILNS